MPIKFYRERKITSSISATIVLLAGSAAHAGDTEASRYGGSFTVGIPVFTICYDGSQTPFVPYVHHSVVDNLLEQDKKTGQILPWLAESYEIQNEGTRYVLHLKKGVTFSNRQPFNAAVIKTNFDNHVELGKLGKSPQASAYLAGYLGTDIVDDYTAAINFKIPKAGFLQALTEKPLGIIAPQTIADKTPEERCAEGVIGSGPYVISSIVEDQEVVLKSRQDYAWNSPNQEHSGRPYVDELVFKLIPESGVRVGSLLSNQIDAITSVPALDIDRLEASGSKLTTASFGGSVYSFFFNYTKPITADAAVRKAILTGIDRQEIIDTAYTKYDHPASGVLSTRVPQYTDQSSKLAYNPEASRKALDAAGWVAGPDGIREKDGTRLAVKFKYSDEADKAPLELVQQQLRKVGIDFQVSQVTRAELTLWEAPNKDWDIIAAPLTRPDADILLSRYHPGYSWWLGGQNLDPYPQVTSLLDQQTKELDPSKRKQLAIEIQDLIVDNAYAVPVREVASIWALAPNAHGLWLGLPGFPNFSDVWVDKD
ncbi:ABC transporter substrate-binding protein [Mesorhizobium sp. DCY119]|uniref:ABC transporter substrate-binding protein n=1 Tax=Mesorhizobium sp. DCY119 TaxID=2108445 RepID=UPI000E772DEB|nr:ABC transporter substrate-binding protein [Mesorhizobium sp. DCY119]RJG40537.1 ABC transporter substrate-binding protein [Mesorhizobium sp. DCY119]